MKKKYSLKIPKYLSIARYQQLQNIDHLTELGKLIKTVNVFTNIPESEIRTWAIQDLGKVAKDFSDKIDIESTFYPIWQHEGIDYGYADISTMTMGEFIDLEQLCKKPNDNLHEIMAVLYRPIKTHRFDKLVWKTKHNIQLLRNKVDNVYKWYTLEEYNNENRYVNAEVMKNLPAGFALGALSFFLGTASLCSISSMTYLDQIPNKKEIMKTMEKETLEALTGIGDGLRHYIRYPKQVFSISQEKLVSLN
jgi:hypothetical protein